MIRILGRNNSINVQKVMWCSAELQLEVKRENIGGAFGGNENNSYLSKNPNGTIPTLIQSDFILWESNSIVRYLCEYSEISPWFPNSLVKRSHAHQWMDWYLTTLHPHMTTIFWQLIRTSEADRDQRSIDKAVETAIKFWSILDSHLERHDYILGEEISMGDIPIGCAAYRWFNLEIKRPHLKNLDRWWKTLSERPSYKTHVMLPLT